MNANLATVAPGIAEALIATAAGLAVDAPGFVLDDAPAVNAPGAKKISKRVESQPMHQCFGL